MPRMKRSVVTNSDGEDTKVETGCSLGPRTRNMAWRREWSQHDYAWIRFNHETTQNPGLCYKIQIGRLLPIRTLLFYFRLHSYFSSLKFILFLDQLNTWTPSHKISFTMTEFKQSLILCIAAVLALTPNAVNALSATLVRLHKSQSCSFIIWRLLFFLESLSSNILATKSIVPAKKWPLLLFSKLQWWELRLHLWGENGVCRGSRRNL